MYFDKIAYWTDADLKEMFLQAESWPRRAPNSLEDRVFNDLLEEMRRRKIPHPCPKCGSESVGRIEAGDAIYHCNDCGNQFN